MCALSHPHVYPIQSNHTSAPLSEYLTHIDLIKKKVSWNWGAGHPAGTVAATSTDKPISITTAKGNAVTRGASPSNPAVRIERDGGNPVVKRASELTVDAKGSSSGSSGSTSKKEGKEGKKKGNEKDTSSADGDKAAPAVKDDAQHNADADAEAEVTEEDDSSKEKGDKKNGKPEDQETASASAAKTAAKDKAAATVAGQDKPPKKGEEDKKKEEEEGKGTAAVAKEETKDKEEEKGKAKSETGTPSKESPHEINSEGKEIRKDQADTLATEEKTDKQTDKPVEKDEKKVDEADVDAEGEVVAEPDEMTGVQASVEGNGKEDGTESAEAMSQSRKRKAASISEHKVKETLQEDGHPGKRVKHQSIG